VPGSFKTGPSYRLSNFFPSCLRFTFFTCWLIMILLPAVRIVLSFPGVPYICAKMPYRCAAAASMGAFAAHQDAAVTCHCEHENKS
jgi:hypothetical protein